MDKCEKCGAEKTDAMRRDGRDIPKTLKLNDNPVLCTDCCAQMPGREWMKRA